MSEAAATPYAEPGGNAAGEALRAAREAAGLSIDAVAQQLKLAPRQVRALEEGDHGALPGRTFVRGFARNYARLLELDADAIVAALPETLAASAHEGAIGVTTRGMGELPVTPPSRGTSWSRWLIPLLLIALIGAAAYYELTRSKRAPPQSDKPLAVRPVPMDPVGPPGLSGSPLPNPLAPSEPPPSAPGPAEATTPPATVAPSEAPIAPTLPITTAPTTVAAPAPEQATLVIAYRGPSWTEVRDANGQRLLVMVGAAGTSETVRGTPPFDLTIGNAAQTSVRWQGEPFDLAPHTRGNVARVRLP